MSTETVMAGTKELFTQFHDVNKQRNLQRVFSTDVGVLGVQICQYKAKYPERFGSFPTAIEVKVYDPQQPESWRVVWQFDLLREWPDDLDAHVASALERGLAILRAAEIHAITEVAP